MKLTSWIVGQVGRQTSCMDLSIRHQIRHTKSDIKELMEMADEFRTKNVDSNTDYLWNIISILYIQQWRNVIIKVPLLNFVRGPGVPLLNFEGGPRVQLLNFREVPRPTFKLRGGSRIQGSEVLIPLLHHAVLLKQFFFCLGYWGVLDLNQGSNSEHPLVKIYLFSCNTEVFLCGNSLLLRK